MYYDINRPIREEMAVYKNKEAKLPTFEWVALYEETQTNESTLKMNLHTGTHMDAPLHKLEGGGAVEDLDLKLFDGPCRVLDLTNVEGFITAEDLIPFQIEEDERILLKTRNSFEEDFNPSYIALSVSAAEYLRDREILSLGIDAMSIGRGETNTRVHEIILGAGIGVLEDVRLAKVPQGDYLITAFPLLLEGREASPTRAILKTI